MHPILYEIPLLRFPISSFGVMVAAGFLLASWVLGKLAERHGDDPERDPARYSRITVWVLVGVILGARLMYVIVEIARGSETGRLFREKPLEILAVWNGGLVMYGGFAGAIAGGLWSARRERVRLMHVCDLGMIAGFLGQAVGRVGCLLVGDDHGRLVPERFADLPFPITLRVPEVLPEKSLFEPHLAGQVVWATQPWMSAKALIVAGVGWWMFRRRRYAGQVALWMILVYAALRYVVEIFRGDTIRGVWFDGALSTSQLVSIVAGAIALVLLVKNRKRRDPGPGRA